MRIARVAVLPAPPVIPLELRLAAAPPVDISHLTEAELTFLGGEDKAREFAERDQRIAIADDSTVDVYDWNACASTVVDQLAAPARCPADGDGAEAGAAADVLKDTMLTEEDRASGGSLFVDLPRATLTRGNSWCRDVAHWSTCVLPNSPLPEWCWGDDGVR
ncbi:hypothetical protein [Streptomyces noursei]|uniref:hypothetical protein n=1 Tax=Streptomyces noursei TaxID=1971 RepID=UPI0038167008